MSKICDRIGESHVDSTLFGVDGLSPTRVPDTDFTSRFLPRSQMSGEISQGVLSRCSLLSPESTRSCSNDSSPTTLVYDEKSLEANPSITREELDVKHILSSVLHLHPQDLDDEVDFDSLGLDSLSSIEALHKLRSELGLNLPRNFFSQCRNIRAVRSYLSSFRQASPAEPAARRNPTMGPLQFETLPLSIQRANPSPPLPLFLFHDGSGLVDYYYRLQPLGRNIWGIPNPNFVSGKPWTSLTSMAASYANHILSTTSGPVLLGGKSFYDC